MRLNSFSLPGGFLVTTGWCVLWGLCAQADDDPAHRNLTVEGPKGWRRWADRMSQAEAKFEFRRVHVSPDKTEEVGETYTLHYFYNGRMRRRHLFKQRGADLWEAIAVRHGNDYWFAAARFGDGPLVVTDFRQGPPHADERMVPWQLRAPYLIQYQELPKLLSDPGFRITNVADERRNDRELVTIEFEYAWQKDPKAAGFKHGTATLVPEFDWGIQQYDVETVRGSHHRWSIEYGQNVDGFIPIRRLTRLIYRENNSLAGREVWDFAICRHRVISEDFFTFKALGLPEPDFAQSLEPSRWRWIWLITVGLVLVFLALRMRSRLQKAE